MTEVWKRGPVAVVGTIPAVCLFGLATAPQAFGGTVTMNMPIPTANTSGFPEFPWFQNWAGMKTQK